MMKNPNRNSTELRVKDVTPANEERIEQLESQITQLKSTIRDLRYQLGNLVDRLRILGNHTI